jgi:hypothetical protein
VDKITVLLGPSTVQCGVGASVSRMCSLQELIVLVSSQFPTGSLDSFNWSQGEYSNKSDFFFWKVGYQHTMNRLCTSLMQRINSVVNFTWLQVLHSVHSYTQSSSVTHTTSLFVCLGRERWKTVL